MIVKNIFRLSNRFICPLVTTRRYGYKVVKRPDPNNLKMPSQGTTASLMQIIKEKIRLNGPLTVAEYMHIVITNPTEGYYMKKETIGEAGDFITSPEIIQLFGEMMAIWFLSETRKMGPGKPLQVVELGPGKGTLMVDFLKVLHQYGYKPADLSLHLVEISETMKNVQAHRLCLSHREMDINSPYNHEGETINGIKVYWYNDLKKVPHNFSWFVAHEFFDVLPIHKFEKTEDGWREILIDLDKDGNLRYRISADETASVKLLIRPPLNTGDRIQLEVSARGLGIARQLATRVDQDGGIALIADYGHNGDKGDTFRAFHKHQLVDPLLKPGECDLTADVDFMQLKVAASAVPGVENYAVAAGPVTQREFLQRIQADCRLQVLLDNAKSDEDREKLRFAYDMLVSPAKMGDRFKFLAFYPSQMAATLNVFPPLGFTKLPTDGSSEKVS